MNVYYRAKGALKTARWKMRRQSAARRWGQAKLDNSPAILGNAMPKSGSHLIYQVLQGLPEIGPAVNPGFPPVNRAQDNRKLEATALQIQHVSFAAAPQANLDDASSSNDHGNHRRVTQWTS